MCLDLLLKWPREIFKCFFKESMFFNIGRKKDGCYLFSFLYFPIGKFRCYVFGLRRCNNNLSMFFFEQENLIQDYSLEELKSSVMKEIEDKVMQREYEFLCSRQKEYWLEDLEYRLVQINDTIKTLRYKGYIFISMVIFLISIGADKFSAKLLKYLKSVSLSWYDFLLLGIAFYTLFYLLNVLLLAYDLFKLNYLVSRSFKDFRKDAIAPSQPIVAYFKDLYHDWYFKWNYLYHKQILPVVSNLQKFALYFMIYFILLAILLCLLGISGKKYTSEYQYSNSFKNSILI